MALRIEIVKMGYKDKWRIRIGDLSGSTEMSSVDMNEILGEIKDSMEELNLLEKTEEKNE